MERAGIVKKKIGDLIEVELEPSSSCHACGLCQLRAVGHNTISMSDKTCVFVEGERVILEYPDKDVAQASFLVYGVSLLFLFLGVFTGSIIFGSRQDLIAVTGIAGLIFGFILIKFVESILKKKSFLHIEVRKHV